MLAVDVNSVFYGTLLFLRSKPVAVKCNTSDLLPAANIVQPVIGVDSWILTVTTLYRSFPPIARHTWLPQVELR